MQTTQTQISPYIYPGIANIRRTDKKIYEEEKNKMAIIFSCPDFVENRTRVREYVWLRNILFFSLVNKFGISPTKIAKLCPYDRTTILHSIKSVETLKDGFKPDKEFMEYFNRNKSSIYNN